jgi:hypothetical protein
MVTGIECRMSVLAVVAQRRRARNIEGILIMFFLAPLKSAAKRGLLGIYN